MKIDELDECKRRCASAVLAAKEVAVSAKRLPKTHKQAIALLLDAVHYVVQFTLEDVLRECGSDDLAFPRELKLLADAREEIRDQMLHHQLVLEGISDQLEREDEN